jgi:hypothetical protein
VSVVLVALAVWCALSVLLAAAHYAWRRFDHAFRPPTVEPAPEPFDQDRDETEPVGSDVSSFFRSYARE